MAKHEKHGKHKLQPSQKLPKDHFDEEGMSRGKSSGPVRKSADAEQGLRGEKK